MAIRELVRRSNVSLAACGRLALLLGVAAGCGGKAEPVTVSSIGAVADGGVADAAPDVVAPCPPDNPFCAPASQPTPSCGNEQLDLDPVGINIMVAIDGSASMATHWPRIQAAVRALSESHPDSQVGLQIFWGELAADYASGKAKNNWCGDTKNNVLDVGNHDANALLSFLGDAPPGPSFVGGLFETSPVVEPLNYYLKNVSKLSDPTRTNYLLFITDGNDNCFGSVFTNKSDKLVAYQKLAVELQKLHIRTVPVGFDAASAPASSGNFGTTPPKTDLDVLSTLLRYGGSGLTDVPKVDDPSRLGDVIAQVGQTVRNCRFAIPGTLDPSADLNPFALSFSVNGLLVARDRKLTNGWDFVEGDTSQVELFGPACQAVRAGAAVVAQKTCAGDVCGTAAIKVETKPRAVLLLLDSSASRIGCADDSVTCLVAPGIGLDRTLSYWEVVEHAVSESLAAAINDDVEFGLQFFPGKDAADFSCDVASDPEIPPAAGTAITIMGKMLEKLPFGFSPVVQVLENVAARPGRLADPAALGAVVMLTDGGDNCAGVPQDELVARLGSAAKSLLDAQVKTYLVRYGSASQKTPEQEAQLRAIVEQGGTATIDPADPTLAPYIDAKTDQELTDALAAISDRLATCGFAIGGLEEDADRANANLYLNGEAIPFDAAATQRDGWSWADTEMTAVQLFGDACNAFKTNRRTSVVMELGCTPIVLR